jgi:hypothetical protein
VNLALPTLVILLGLLPGIACFYGYFAGRFDKRTAGVSGVEQLALFVVFAVPIDVAALWFLAKLDVHFNFDVATHLMVGTVSDAAVHGELAAFFQQSTLLSSASFMIVLGAAFALGSVIRRAVWASRLDAKIPHFRLKHEWFYILQGRLKGLPRVVLAYADVMTHLPDRDGGQTRLFRGLVVDFEISTSGSLESVALRNAVRGSGRGDQFEWKPIPSTRLVIMGSTIHSINLTYFGMEEGAQETTVLARAWQRVRAWLRSFAFEEP